MAALAEFGQKRAMAESLKGCHKMSLALYARFGGEGQAQIAGRCAIKPSAAPIAYNVKHQETTWNSPAKS